MNTLPLNKDRIVGQKTPLQISYIWGIRIRFEQEDKMRDMALDSKLRGCDLVNLKVGAQGGDQLLRRGPGGDIVQGLGVLYLLGGGQVQAAFQLLFHREGVEQPSQPGQGHAAPLLLVGQRGVAGVGEGGCR